LATICRQWIWSSLRWTHWTRQRNQHDVFHLCPCSAQRQNCYVCPICLHQTATKEGSRMHPNHRRRQPNLLSWPSPNWHSRPHNLQNSMEQCLIHPRCQVHVHRH
jgi:hypothetical protein